MRLSPTLRYSVNITKTSRTPISLSENSDLCKMSNKTTNVDYPQVAPESGLHPVILEQHKEVATEQQFQLPLVYQAAPAKQATFLIGGFKPWIFWFVISFISLVVVGASVGGAVAGVKAVKNSNNNSSPPEVTV